MDRSVELPASVPELRVVRATTTSLHTGMKDRYGIGRIDRGDTQWWGSGRIWRSTRGCVLMKRPGDVVRHLSHQGPTTFTAVTLPNHEIERIEGEGRVATIPQLESGDPRAVPFHRLLDAASAGADRLALDVALVEALNALVAMRGPAVVAYSRPVKRAMDYLRTRLEDSITLDDLADHAVLDKFHLCRAFRAQIGMPPHAYLTHLRVARAKALLESGLRASDIAPCVGFCDQAQLTRHFHRLVGTTPARYAKRVSDARYRGVVRASFR